MNFAYKKTLMKVKKKIEPNILKRNWWFENFKI